MGRALPSLPHRRPPCSQRARIIPSIHPHAIRCCRRSSRIPRHPQIRPTRSAAGHATAGAARNQRLDLPDDIEDVQAPEWTEEDVVHLHWRLLLELRRLPDPETPLEEKLDTLAWALTDPSLDGRPFSFANCLRVVGTSPMSPTPYFGLIQVDEIRDWLRANARKWIGTTIARYPEWVQRLIRAQPDWVAKQLARNPQWINEQIKLRDDTQQADLFVNGDPQ